MTHCNIQSIGAMQADKITTLQAAGDLSGMCLQLRKFVLKRDERLPLPEGNGELR